MNIFIFYDKNNEILFKDKFISNIILVIRTKNGIHTYQYFMGLFSSPLYWTVFYQHIYHIKCTYSHDPMLYIGNIDSIILPWKDGL